MINKRKGHAAEKSQLFSRSARTRRHLFSLECRLAASFSSGAIPSSPLCPGVSIVSSPRPTDNIYLTAAERNSRCGRHLQMRAVPHIVIPAKSRINSAGIDHAHVSNLQNSELWERRACSRRAGLCVVLILGGQGAMMTWRQAYQMAREEQDEVRSSGPARVWPAWSMELNDPAEDIYTLSGGQPVDGSV